jgi:hypothetical protein
MRKLLLLVGIAFTWALSAYADPVTLRGIGVLIQANSDGIREVPGFTASIGAPFTFARTSSPFP